MVTNECRKERDREEWKEEGKRKREKFKRPINKLQSIQAHWSSGNQIKITTTPFSTLRAAKIKTTDCTKCSTHIVQQKLIYHL